MKGKLLPARDGYISSEEAFWTDTEDFFKGVCVKEWCLQRYYYFVAISQIPVCQDD